LPPSLQRRSPRNVHGAIAYVPPLHFDAEKTADVIHAQLGEQLLGKGMELSADYPRGPWCTANVASAAPYVWSFVNGFKLIKDSGSTLANARSGAKSSLACSFVRAAGSSATQRKTTSMGDHGEKCPFRICLEESTTGWVISSAHPCHSDGHISYFEVVFTEVKMKSVVYAAFASSVATVS
jgi:hypothetical protein